MKVADGESASTPAVADITVARAGGRIIADIVLMEVPMWRPDGRSQSGPPLLTH